MYRLTGITALWLCLGCSGKGGFEALTSPDSSSERDSSEESQETLPQDITGYYIACAETNESEYSPDPDDTLVGCNVKLRSRNQTVEEATISDVVLEGSEDSFTPDLLSVPEDSPWQTLFFIPKDLLSLIKIIRGSIAVGDREFPDYVQQGPLVMSKAHLFFVTNRVYRPGQQYDDIAFNGVASAHRLCEAEADTVEKGGMNWRAILLDRNKLANGGKVLGQVLPSLVGHVKNVSGQSLMDNAQDLLGWDMLASKDGKELTDQFQNPIGDGLLVWTGMTIAEGGVEYSSPNDCNLWQGAGGNSTGAVGEVGGDGYEVFDSDAESLCYEERHLYCISL